MIKYNVNKDKGTVVAYFDGGKDYWYDSLVTKVQKILRGLSIIDGDEMCDIAYNIIYHDKTCFVGKAKVCIGDVFDEEVGKKLAHDRLLDLYERAEAQMLTMFMKKMNKEVEMLTERI